MEGLNFNDLKKKVGVDDIAYSLGYRLNRGAGVGFGILKTKRHRPFSTAMVPKAVM